MNCLTIGDASTNLQILFPSDSEKISIYTYNGYVFSFFSMSSVCGASYTLFFGWESPFSQWHPCEFMIDGITYNCAEQYMMVGKVNTFTFYYEF